MKNLLKIILLVIFLAGCGDNIESGNTGISSKTLYSTEEIDVYDNSSIYWGKYLHYFTNSIIGLEKILTDLGYELEAMDPQLSEEIIVVDTTVTLAPNITYAMGEKKASFAGTFYVRNESGSFPIGTEDEEGDIFFLLHVTRDNRFYSGVYIEVLEENEKKENVKTLKWHYLPDWITPIGNL